MSTKPEDEIEALSASYVPEWRFIREGSELGSGLALLFCRLYRDSLFREEETPLRLKKEFLRLAGNGLKEAKPSRGIMVFSLVKPDLPETSLQAGTQIISQDSQGGDVNFLTEEEICVSGNSVTKIVECRGCWYICLQKPVTLPLYHGFLIPEETVGKEPGRLILECAGSGGFHRLELADETEGLVRSGMFIFSGCPDQERFVCLGEEGYWLRLRDQKGRALPNKPGRLFLNAARVRAADTGARTNLLAGLSHKLAFTSGFLSEITNPQPLYGGSDEEADEEAAKRWAARFLHRDRAVMPEDYQRLSMEACPLVRKARCFPGYNGAGEKEAGAVTVVVLLQSLENGNEKIYDGQRENGITHMLLEEIYQFLAVRCDSGLIKRRGLTVTTPLMVRIDGKAQVAVDVFYEALSVRRKAVRALEKYLSPMGTEGDGIGQWSMGNLPDYQRIRHLLSKVEHVTAVKRLYLTCRIRKDGRMTEVPLEEIRQFPWCLPCSGTHEITILGEESWDTGSEVTVHGGGQRAAF